MTGEVYFLALFGFVLPSGIALTLLMVAGMMTPYVTKKMDELIEADPAKALSEVTRRNAKRVEQRKGSSVSKELLLRLCIIFGLGRKSWVLYSMLSNQCLDDPNLQSRIVKLNHLVKESGEDAFPPEWLLRLEFDKPAERGGQ